MCGNKYHATRKFIIFSQLYANINLLLLRKEIFRTLLLILEPGEIFVHRNIANSVTRDDINSNAVLEYAIEHLGIQDIVIGGHTYCGGISSVIEQTKNKKGNNKKSKKISKWLLPIQRLYEENRSEFDDINDEYIKSRKLSEMNVKRVVDIVNGLDSIKSARRKRKVVNVHGWIYLMEKGIFEDLKVTKSR
ncbi:Carbonic anhydrase [Smittium culicis]|uniref:Carbonic anhydrase n=1 Tax=Smittium culicis TaxID=133412 RepID=A0A1R1Y1J9_9FUNG|nr:Carbonic anhydrase [Smittium culicis]